MKKQLKTLVGILCVVVRASATDYAGFVDVFTGTAGTGHTHPSAACPFGMIQAGPDTGIGDWAYCSGYQYRDGLVYGYSQNHLSGTGCTDYGDVQVLPFSARGEVGEENLPMTREIDKARERAEPGFYGVYQVRDGVSVEIAAARRAAIYRFRYEKGGSPSVLINLPFGESDWLGAVGNKTKDALVTMVENRRVEGVFVRKRVWVNGRIVAFALEFDHPWKRIIELPKRDADAAPTYVAAFDLGSDGELKMKVAVCTTDAEGARANLLHDIPQWDFDRVRRETREAWNREFAKSVADGTSEQLANWYTALYHLYLQPNDWADVDGRYRGPDWKIRSMEGGRFFTTLSMWDTFRAAQPWCTIIEPDVARGVVYSLLAHADAMNGRLPVMSYGGGNVDCMIGNHAVPILVDACLKGVCPAEIMPSVFRAVRETLTREHPGKPKENWAVYDRYGYYPCDLVKSESVSRTLECSYDDWCAFLLAERLGLTTEARFFAKRATNWRNVLDPVTRMMRGRDSEGRWQTPFNPYALGGGDERENCFTEGNSFQYTWHVLQNPDGLIAEMGGREEFVRRLDALFAQPERIDGMGERVDVSGLIGQYAHGNEPSHHIAYFYTLAGRSDRTAEIVREVCDRFYRLGPQGLCGNDDCGQMSAWYLFSAMGFYPFNPCNGEYVIGAPQLPRVSLHLANGKMFVMTAKNLSRKNRYVKSVTLNGKLITDRKIRHAEILRGGELSFEMMESWP